MRCLRPPGRHVGRLGIEQEPPHAARPDRRRDGRGGAVHPRAPDARGRRLRRQGLADGHACRLPPLAGDGTYGEDRDVLPGRAARREHPPPRHDHGPHRGYGGRLRHRHADGGVLRQRRVRRVQARPERQPARPGAVRQLLPVHRARRDEPHRLHEHAALGPHALAGRAAGQLRGRVAVEHHRGGAWAGRCRVPQAEPAASRRHRPERRAVGRDQGRRGARRCGRSDRLERT